MSRVVTVEAQPRATSDGTLRTVRLAGGGRDRPYFYDAAHWRGGVATLPRFAASLKFGEQGWTGGSTPQSGDIVFRPSDARLLYDLSGLYWRDAPITVKSRDELGGGATVELAGTVAGVAIADGAMTIAIADLSRRVDTPLVIARFAGTGGLEGGEEAEGRIKRRSWGRVFDIEGRITDKANNVYEFGDPAFPLQQFDVVRDKGRSGPFTVLAWQGSAAATLAGLTGAAVPQGGGVVAPSIARAKWWTQPSGPLTADLRGEIGSGYVETAPAIAARIAAAGGGLAIANVSDMADIRAGAAGWHAEGETTAQALDQLLAGVSLLWVLEPSGLIRLREWTFDDPVEELVSLAVIREAVFPPMKSRRVGYRRNNRIHSDGEISAALYSGLASEILFEDGTTVQDSQPAEPGATAGSTIGVDLRNPDGSLYVPVDAGFDPSDIFDAIDAVEDAVGDAAGTIAGILAKTRDGAPNLLVNGDFRDGLSGWNPTGGGWSVVTGFPIGPFLQNTGAAIGAFAFRDVPLQALKSYSLSAEMDPDQAGAMQVYLDWLDTGGAVIANAPGIQADGWMRVAGASLAAPTGTVAARIRVHRIGAGIIRATRIQIQEGTATAWNGAASDYDVATRLTVEETQRQGDGVAYSQRFEVIEAQVDGTTDSGLKASIDDNRIAAADDTSAVATEVTNITARLRQGSPNLIPNGDFADGLEGWLRLGDGWETVNGFSIGPFAQHAPANTSPVYLYRDLPAQAGTSYSLSAEFDPDASGTTFAYVDWLGAGGSAIAGGAALITGAGWIRANSSVVTAPLGTTVARIVIVKLPTSGIGRATRIQLQEGQATDFRADASIVAAFARVGEERTARVNDVGAVATRAATLEAQMAGTADSSLKASIEEAATAAADATSAAATVETNITARLRQGSPNLLVNSDFHDGLNGWTPDGSGWFVVGGFAVGPFAQNATAGTFLRQDVPAQAGTFYTLSGEFGPDTSGAIRAYVDWLDAAGAAIGNALEVTGESFARAASATQVAPTGAAKARVRIHQVTSATGRATRLQLQQGPSTDYRADQSLGDLTARVTEQAGVLVDLQGKTQAFWRVEAAVPGQRTQLTVFANNDEAGVDIVGDVRISGDLLVGGTVTYGAMNVSDFRSRVVDSDTGSYSNVTPNSTLSIAGISATLPNTKPDGEITFKITATVTLTSAGSGLTNVYDSFLVVRAADALGGVMDYPVPLLSQTGVQYVNVRHDADSTLSGDCTITARLYHGNTFIHDGDPSIPDSKSVHIAAANVGVDIRWHW